MSKAKSGEREIQFQDMIAMMYPDDIQRIRAKHPTSSALTKEVTFQVTDYWNSYYAKRGVHQALDMWCPKEWAVPIIGEEEYDNLAFLTESLGGFVNRDTTYITGYTGDTKLEDIRDRIQKEQGR